MSWYQYYIQAGHYDYDDNSYQKKCPYCHNGRVSVERNGPYYECTDCEGTGMITIHNFSIDDEVTVYGKPATITNFYIEDGILYYAVEYHNTYDADELPQTNIREDDISYLD